MVHLDQAPTQELLIISTPSTDMAKINSIIVLLEFFFSICLSFQEHFGNVGYRFPIRIIAWRVYKLRNPQKTKTLKGKGTNLSEANPGQFRCLFQMYLESTLDLSFSMYTSASSSSLNIIILFPGSQ